MKIHKDTHTNTKMCRHYHIISYTYSYVHCAFSAGGGMRLAQPGVRETAPKKRWNFSHNQRRWWQLQNSWESFEAAAPNRVTMPGALRSQSGPAGGPLDPINTVYAPGWHHKAAF